ncbi:amidase signature domain-containing protein [Aspergillus alliaceus]|uniref:amidase signature domain-containing protein n=1 Tax=Petromyces alliaceus TaxID=209559 RepID=UPI0012A44C15|nr:amidase signature domain-containing protein [Aspergillus alliaceus]KAB8234256.1 amidase signature domain-containing protein [Aspergillus alliaceus]
MPAQIDTQWEQITALRAEGKDIPLFGVPFAVKDNIDAAGFCTKAACPLFATEPFTTDATVVSRLKNQGVIVVAKTNLDQFATGPVGTRPQCGAVANVFDPDRVSGTDTAGSGRVPAGFNNVIGLKPIPGALSTHGVLPACRTLDCVSIFALTLEDAELV